MAKIKPFAEGVLLLLDPAEILHLRIWHHPEKVRDFTDALRTTGWRLLTEHGKKFIEGKTFAYADVQVIDGTFSIIYFYQAHGREVFDSIPPSC